MNKFIIASCIIALALGWTASPSDHCSCSDYYLSTECSSLFGCSWNAGTTSTCQKANCTAQQGAACLTFPTACYLNTTAGNNTCLAFSSCSSLKGATDADCQAQNALCGQTSTTGTNCVDFKCSSYSGTTCPTARGCYLNGATCSNTPTCSTGTAANCTTPYCAMNGTTCQQAVCGSYTTELSCSFVYLSGTSVQPCSWNATGSACINAPGTGNLTSTTCFTNTLGAYHWSSASTTDGSCKSCYGVLLQIVFAILLLLA
ncbi:unnamed protein product (macronuclear) [Paramecium tetraurelia]|uniref:Chromosome undetermined scaffold_1, whole genome shotgun sequence n=1 Tax=Paramecium tetraurelia TaxID=5888 RepID=Q6BG33_PARTE|nr:Surface protein [Paramecium tetraurelia strain d4-2]XP_001423296.1 uncharacterized protein GSPATT00000333001 [Paramecium tetraurelia]CAH03387.1 Surface protein, putative [Paramecium tetraurelia]CAI44462.1 Mini antigen [Paramecium tetraurelia]CAK55898.1 unnamed protein product [Paramecium tetraurelia]|eukprot:XP_001423296.1 hypothetical protein (macronuclear) [Paramecium tetraurelia strain d4-2]